MKASWGASTPPIAFIRFLPLACFCSDFFWRLMPPPPHVASTSLRTTLSFLLSTAVIMAQVLIRQLDEQVLAVLKARARARGVSLEQSLRDLLTAAAREGTSLRDELARLRATTPAAGRSLDVAALIREDRDGR
jgi:plasmid stability protein